MGHEDWVHSVCWRPRQQPVAPHQQHNGHQQETGQEERNGQQQQKGQEQRNRQEQQNGQKQPEWEQQAPSRAELTLLSASQDRSMLLWRCDVASGLWLSEASVGDAGATCLGYFGGVFSPDGCCILAHGFTGALHMWAEQQRAGGDRGGGGGGGATWLPRHACGGHFGEVVDACWGADGGCVQTVSTDQTARLFTEVNGKWCELARTQVHGHDFSCLASIPCKGDGDGGASGSSYMYCSGSEEKVLRVFEAPTAFLDSLDLARGRAPGGMARPRGVRRALGAAVGALALSNKAVYVEGGARGGVEDAGAAGGMAGLVGVADYPEGPDMLPRAMPQVIAGQPLEEHLAQNTLWPEIRKLYGHGNDVYCAAASPCGRLVASACRAQAAGAAAVWVWEVGSWRAVAQLPGHGLTVTQLAFSPGGGLLLAGSRDRSFSVWRVGWSGGGSGEEGSEQQQQQQQAEFSLLKRVKAAHARIIWGVSWSHDAR